MADIAEATTDNSGNSGQGGSRGGRGGGRNQRGGGNTRGRGGGGDRRGGNQRDDGENRQEGGGGSGHRHEGGGRGGRGRGGGNRQETDRDRGGRRGGRGGGDRKNIGDHNVDMRKYERMITATKNNFSDIKMTDPVTEECMICCKPNDIFGVGSCRHPLCIECAIRIRIIANNDACPVCRQPMETMAFVFASSDPTTVSIDLPSTRHPDEDRYKVRFQNKAAGERYEMYLSHVCKLCIEDGERLEFPSFVSLRQHMAQKHDLSFCHHCLANLALFSRERSCFTRSQLQDHIRGGDRDDRSQKGHPKCLYCEQRFFDEEERYRHLRREHFFCQLCEVSGQASNVFFGKHDELIMHYSKKHFLCEVDECKKAGIAFGTSLDLDIHRSREHPDKGRKGIALDFSFNDRQVGGPSSRIIRSHQNQQQQQAPLPQGPYGVGLIPAEAPQPRSDPSQFVVVPSAQASRPSLRYARTGGFNAVSSAEEAFPSLGGSRPTTSTTPAPYRPQIAASAAGINYATGPPVVVPCEFPRLKSSAPSSSSAPAVRPPPSVSAASIVASKGKKKPEKKVETLEESFPSLSSVRSTKQPQSAKHTLRHELFDDDERAAQRLVNDTMMGPPPSLGPSTGPPKVAMISRATLAANAAAANPSRGKNGLKAPKASSTEDFPALGGGLGSTSNWGQKMKEQSKRRPPPAPLPESDMWTSSSIRPQSSGPSTHDESWKEVTVQLSQKALRKRENEAKKARLKEEKRLRALAAQREESDDDEEEEEEEEEEDEVEETKMNEQPVLGLSEISRLITAAPPTSKNATKKKKEPQPVPSKPPVQEQQKPTSSNKNKKDKKKGGNGQNASTTVAPPTSSTEEGTLASTGLGLIGSVLCLLAALVVFLFNSVYSSIVGSPQEEEAPSAPTTKANGASAAPSKTAPHPTTKTAPKAPPTQAPPTAQMQSLSMGPPPGLSCAPPPGFGPPPGFEGK